MYKTSVFIKQSLGCRNTTMLCQISNIFMHLDKTHVLPAWACSVTIWREGAAHVFSGFELPDETGWLLSGRSLTEHSHQASWCWGISCVLYDLLGQCKLVPTEVCLPKMGLRWNLVAYCRILKMFISASFIFLLSQIC